MRRGIYVLIFLFGVLIAFGNKINIALPKNSTIPDEAIRLRVIANSDLPEDVEIKHMVKDAVLGLLQPYIENLSTNYEVRREIYCRLPEIETVIKQVLDENEVTMSYYVDYGISDFPDKVYEDRLYPKGKYESVYIVLGEGQGENFWCVLFPSLCLVDVAHKGQADNGSDVKYSFLIIEKLKELFGHK